MSPLNKLNLRLKSLPKNPNSERIILGEVMELAWSVIRELFGTMGSQEFVIDDTKLKSNKWVVSILRRIDNLNLRYEIVIDNETGRVIRFRKIKQQHRSKKKKIRASANL
jgi:hypothetical protein